MQNEGISPDVVTFTCILKACGKAKNVQMGKQIHEEIINRGLLEKDVVLGTALVDMYIKCDELKKAKEVLIELPVRDVVTWNALIAGYAQEGQGHEALICFEWMQSEGFSSDLVTFLSVLKACGVSRDVDKGKLFHDEIVAKGLLEKDIAIGNAVIDMYAKCGALTKAHQVLEDLPFRNAISWNSLVAGYALEGQDHNALNCFEQMQSEGISPDTVAFACILKACASIGEISKGHEIHSKIVIGGFLEKDTILGNVLVDMYVKHGLLRKAQEVFEKLAVQDAVSWNALIAGYSQHGYCEEALNYFEQMRVQGHYPSADTLASVFQSHGTLGASQNGQDLHAEIEKDRFLINDIVVGNALVDMYMKCGLIGKAQEIFHKISVKNVVSWTVLITGYTSHGHNEEALSCFDQMENEGTSPNMVTIFCILKACAIARAANRGQEIHSSIVRNGLFDKDVSIGNALICMYANCGMLNEAQSVFDNLRILDVDSSKALIAGYAKCGWFVKAQEVFDKLPVRDVVLWNGLLLGYVQHQHSEEALKCFEMMQHEVSSLDIITFVFMLKSCGNIGAVGKGQEGHVKIVKGGLEKDMIVANALVDMYANFGMLIESQEVFDKLSVKNMMTWTALISAYAQIGQNDDVIKSTAQMIGEGNEPDVVIFTILLSMCSHSGLVDEGQMCFETMITNYSIIPTLEHYACLVDLFCRSGQLYKAMVLVRELPFSTNLSVWHTVLGACQKWGDLNLGKVAFENAIQLDEKDGTAYVSMSNLYAAKT